MFFQRARGFRSENGIKEEKKEGMLQGRKAYVRKEGMLQGRKTCCMEGRHIGRKKNMLEGKKEGRHAGRKE
jgi:hypothetical protein